jgi:hypothetical protein
MVQMVQVYERSSGNSLSDTLSTRIERAIHIGAHCKETLECLIVRDDVLG